MIWKNTEEKVMLYFVDWFGFYDRAHEYMA